MGKHFNSSIKLEVLNKYLNNEGSLNTLSRQYDIPRSTIYKWIKQTRDGKDITIRQKGSGRIKEENIDYKERYEILKKYQAFLKAQRERK
ncbi:MAG: helix-turn-helix domain-containing protein [Bacilli bacterium]|nr:helix-turn-helix domain-containing protein [Bacilli bacterium]